jgi:hypothetical protein
MVTKVTAFFHKYMIASAHYLKSFSGAGVNTAPVSWPVNGPKRFGIHLASDCCKPPYQWLRQTNSTPLQSASLDYFSKALSRSVLAFPIVIFLYFHGSI